MHLSRLVLLSGFAAMLAGSAGASPVGFDAELASQAYLGLVKGAVRARSDAYFEGGYWLLLWTALVSLAVDALILRFRIVRRLHDHASRLISRPWLSTWLTGLVYLLIAGLLTLPWRIYSGFVRERQYGLLNQDLAAWLGESLISLVLTCLMLSVLIVAVYGAIRRWPRLWWLAGAGATASLMAIVMLVAPVYIQPLFNTYGEMPQSPLRSRIVAMANSHDVPAEHIYVFDASRQSNRISANVSGLGPTIRISLNDNLLNRTSDAEVMAVVGHELGHYVMGHSWRITVGLGLLSGVMFFFSARIARSLIARYGRACGVSELADPASMPFFSIAIALFSLVATPANNLLIRTSESAADRFGLDTAREPDGFARISMRLSEYRKLEPGPLEEFLFYDHPSGATRVRMAMTWKKRHVPDARMVFPDGGQSAVERSDRARTSPAITSPAPDAASQVQR